MPVFRFRYGFRQNPVGVRVPAAGGTTMIQRAQFTNCVVLIFTAAHARYLFIGIIIIRSLFSFFLSLSLSLSLSLHPASWSVQSRKMEQR